MTLRLLFNICFLHTSDAADDNCGVDLGGRRIIKKKTGGGGSEARADLAVRDLRLHLVEVRHIKGHGVTS